MTKTDEKRYFKKIGKNGVDFTLHKPFSDSENVGALLSDISAIFTLMPKSPACVADLGCGSGWTSEFYARAGHNVTGIDISQTAVDAACKFFKRDNLSFVCFDFDKMPFMNEFDVAVFNDSLHHTDDEIDTLKSVYKILKPGGIIIICEPGSGHSRSPSSLEAIKKYGVNERDMPPKLSKRALLSAGFREVKTYGHPSKLHRFNYKEFSGLKAVFNNTALRAVMSLSAASFMKNNHGIVTARK